MSAQAPSPDPERPTLVYAFDPLCGWCFGFRNTFAELRRALAGRVRWELACAGLFTGTRERPIVEAASYIRRSIVEVEARLHVRFGQPYLDGVLASDWVARSEPPCRATLLVQELAGTEKALDFGSELLRAHFEDGRLPDEETTLSAVAERVGVDAAALLERWRSPEARAMNERTLSETRARGVRMFPSLFLRTADSLRNVFEGCPDRATVFARVEEALGAAATS